LQPKSDAKDYLSILQLRCFFVDRLEVELAIR
jgi:hypothetical protein